MTRHTLTRLAAVATVAVAVGLTGASGAPVRSEPQPQPCVPVRPVAAAMLTPDACVGPLAEDARYVALAMRGAVAMLPGSHPVYGPRPWGAVAGARRPDGCAVLVAVRSDGTVRAPFGPQGCDR